MSVGRIRANSYWLPQSVEYYGGPSHPGEWQHKHHEPGDAPRTPNKEAGALKVVGVGKCQNLQPMYRKKWC